MRSKFVFTLVVIGCGGSVTSVDGNENTANLTPADQDQLCLDTYNYVRNSFSNDDLAKLECGFATITSADPSACASSYNSCLVQARANIQQIQWPLAPDCTGFDQNVAACNTTVSEYAKCLQQEVDVAKTLESGFPYCSQAAAEAAAISAAGHLTQDCIAMFNTCKPSFVPKNSGGGAPDAGGG
jgi:hypothetical protein